MAITNAQQYKQLVNPPMKGNKRPGYRGDDAAYSTGAAQMGRADPGTRSGGPSGGPDRGGRDDVVTAGTLRRNQLALENAAYKRGQEELDNLKVADTRLPAFFPGGTFLNIGLGATTKFRQKMLDRNVDYFKNLSGIENKGYPKTAEGYRQYMRDRLAGKIDAAGNTLMTGGDGPQQPIIPVDTTFAQTPSNMNQETDTTEEDEGLRLAFRADGGIMGGLADGQMDEMGRQMYGLGKLVKKATRAVKKIAKSPIGKAALLYTGAGALGNLAGGSGLAGIFKGFTSPSAFLGRVPGIFSKGGLENIMSGLKLGKFVGPPSDRVFEKNFLGKALTSPMGLITGASVVAGLLTPEQEDQAQQLADNTGFSIEEARNAILQAAKENYAMDVRARGFKADGGLMRLGFDEGGKDLSTDANYKGWKKLYEKNPDAAAINENHQEYLNFYERNKTKQAEGSKEPVAKKTMPLLDMGGMEKDYREDGGFVPIGRMERADDVPARLSKNEFVFTADAVRNAGDGDIDKGAEVMYNMMKNLEAGGEVSEESQGLEGARRMFQTSQRLEEVL